MSVLEYSLLFVPNCNKSCIVKRKKLFMKQTKNKSLIFLIFFLTTNFSNNILFSQSEILSNSRWKLIKIENHITREEIFPEKDYFISFQNGIFKYSLERNTCYGKYESLKQGIRIYNTGGCTKICCDGGISKKLNYNGAFEINISGNQLILYSEKKTFEFKREDKY